MEGEEFRDVIERLSSENGMSDESLLDDYHISDDDDNDNSEDDENEDDDDDDDGFSTLRSSVEFQISDVYQKDWLKEFDSETGPSTSIFEEGKFYASDEIFSHLFDDRILNVSMQKQVIIMTLYY
jgi:hypothetical protein